MVSVTERPSAPAARPPEVRQGPADRSGRSRIATIALWSFRAVMLTPFVLMGPELVSLLTDQPGAVENVAESTADVLGTSSMLFMQQTFTRVWAGGIIGR